MALAGAVLGGRYVLDQQIGAGGYSEVWQATDTILLRPVAVKLLHPRHAGRSEALTRFQAEARHAGALTDQNIARVYDYGEPAGGLPPYLVMELVDGPSLETVLEGGPLDASRTMDVIAQAAAGLQAAHAAGLIHRDIKPANLLLAPGGIVKVTDFGIAHTADSEPVTATGELVGTPGYLAPERLSGERATPASDLYALGMVAYECMAGTRPFTGPALVVALAHRDRPLPPLPPWVAPGVAELVMQLTAKDPAWRPGCAADVAVRAERLKDGLTAGSPAGPHPSSVPSAGQPLNAARLRRIALAGLSIAVAAVIGLVLATIIGFASPHRPAVPVASGSSRGSGVMAQPSNRPGKSSGRLPAASPVAHQEPVTNVAVVAAARASGKQVPASGPGGKKGHGYDRGTSPGNGPGHGNGNGNRHGTGNAQTDSTSG